MICERAFFDQIPVIMRVMRRRFGTRFILVAASDNRRDEIKSWCAAGDQIIVHSELLERAAAHRPRGEELYRSVDEIERRHGITMIRDVIMQDRGYAGWMLAYAEHDPHSQRIDESYETILGRLVVYFDYWAQVIDSQGVDFVFAQTGGADATAMVHEAMLRKIPVSIIVHSRFGSHYTWSSDAYLGNSVIKEAWKAIDDDIELLPMPERPLAAISEKNMASVAVWRSTRHLLRNIAVATYNRLVWRWRDLKRRRWSARLPYLSVCRKHVATWRLFRQLDALVESDTEKVTERPYILFLLSLEPEYTTLTLAREFNNTEAVVRQLAQCMPAGMRLVVKEHVTNIGNRSIEFYRRILRLPNVVLADYRIPGVSLAARAEAVAAISGTIGIEASMLGKDIISFSDKTEYAFLPNVHVVRSFYDLPATVRKATRKKGEAEILAVRRDVARFRKAVMLLSYDVPEGLEMGGNGMLQESEAEVAVDVLLKVLENQRRRYESGESFGQY
jgi:hypothetical protein